jgi:hypothetical protein
VYEGTVVPLPSCREPLSEKHETPPLARMAQVAAPPSASAAALLSPITTTRVVELFWVPSPSGPLPQHAAVPPDRRAHAVPQPPTIDVADPTPPHAPDRHGAISFRGPSLVSEPVAVVAPALHVAADHCAGTAFVTHRWRRWAPDCHVAPRGSRLPRELSPSRPSGRASLEWAVLRAIGDLRGSPRRPASS